MLPVRRRTLIALAVSTAGVCRDLVVAGGQAFAAPGTPPFFTYSHSPPGALPTEEGIGLGSTDTDPQAAYDDRHVLEDELGFPFLGVDQDFDTPEALSGGTTGPALDDRASLILRGPGCRE